jgi:hypothetical protein
MRSSVVVATMLLLLAVGHPSAAQGPKVPTSCDSRAWINANAPEKPVFPKPSDVCPADFKKPLFTREGTLACPTQQKFDAAFNAMRYGWADPRTGRPLSAQGFGCRILPDGIAVKLFGQTFSEAQTNEGWMHQNNLRN